MDENKNIPENKENLPQENNDDFIIGEGFEISDDQETSIEPVKETTKKNGKKALVKPIVWIGSIVVVAVIIAIGAIYIGADYLGIGFGRGKDVSLDIPYGSTGSQIAQKLEDCGAVKLPTVFRLYAKLKGYDSQFKYGLYNFNTEAGYEELAQMLINQGAKAETVRVTIPEGTGINDYVKNVNGEKVIVPGIATLLEKAGVCTAADFKEALENVKFDSKLLKNADKDKTYYPLEGYLFAETYDFYSYDSKECAVLAVKKMIAESENRITDDMYKKAEEMGYSINEILTMASIIQMEAGQNITDANREKIGQQMAGVSAVFYNRLNSNDFTTLGSSPTCYYGDSFKNDDGRYNTYDIKGLPPGPMCSPSLEAIQAAFYPMENSPYYYFVTDKYGKFYFHKTLAEQNKTINRLKQEGNWIYEYFN